jgi:multidrug transporter EmrE-like cation transporter
MPVFITALISILFSVVAQVALKSGMSSPGIREAMSQGASPLRMFIAASQEPLVWFGFALYGAGALVWLLVLAKWDLSKAYPLVGMGFLLTMASSVWMLGERLDWQRALGTLLVVTGVLFVVRS